MSGDGSNLSDNLLRTLYEHARAEFPKECCGYLQDSPEGLVAVTCTNYQDKLHALDPETYPRTSERGYQIYGKQLIAMSKSLDSEFPVRIVYHSHPRVGAYFSDEDAAAANAAGWPVDYLVIDAQEHEIREAVLFRRDGDSYREINRYRGLGI